MAEFDFYGTWNDDWRILGQVAAGTGARLIPDKWYETKQPEIYTELTEELKRDLMKKRGVFVCPSDAPLYPDCGLVQQTEGIMRGRYSVRHRELGDSLDLTLPSCFEKDGMLRLGNGSLFLAPQYYHHVTSSWERPAESLKVFYQEVRRILKRNLLQIQTPESLRDRYREVQRILKRNLPQMREQTPPSKIWIGADAKRLLDAGEAAIGGFSV